MIKALKALQEKIRALEQDRAAAAEKLRHLSEEAQKHTTASTTAAQGHTMAPSQTHQRPASPQPRTTTLSQEQGTSWSPATCLLASHLSIHTLHTPNAPHPLPNPLPCLMFMSNKV